MKIVSITMSDEQYVFLSVLSQGNPDLIASKLMQQFFNNATEAIKEANRMKNALDDFFQRGGNVE